MRYASPSLNQSRSRDGSTCVASFSVLMAPSKSPASLAVLAASSFSFSVLTVMFSFCALAWASCCAFSCSFCSGVRPWPVDWVAASFLRSISCVSSSRPTGMPVMWNISFPSGPNSVTLYLPGAMPSEKYSPFLLSLRVYLRPVSILSHSTVPLVTGFPSASLQTPFTVPVAWANKGGTHRPSTRATSSVDAKRCFIGASTNQLSLRIEDFRLQIPRRPTGRPLNLQSETETRNSSSLPRRCYCGGLQVRDWIPAPRFLEGTQPQHTAIANATGPIFPAIARPS